ncbi:MAG: hydrolase [Betaproteobacteria bacterium HGW-Betaproteobacteria-8]|nr:MAG: hydrolase [Betaproteobacteria bacterium HGW-Betaproteobacteria-8]
MSAALEKLVQIPADHAHIEGMLVLPENAQGLVLFAHGSGSSRHSPRNNYVAQVLRDAGTGTLLMDLLTPEEDMDYQTRFDIPLLTQRLLAATNWIKAQRELQNLPIGYFGASTGAAAALQAAAVSGDEISAVVSRGGRPDLAGTHALHQVQCPVLLLVGGHDDVVIDLNRDAYEQLQGVKEMIIIPGATHLFDEPGTLEEVARQAALWFGQYLRKSVEPS